MKTEEKLCHKCEQWKPMTDFRIRKNGQRHSPCKECERTKMLQSYHKNREKNILHMALYRKQARIDAIEHYGGKCACCGEDRKEFLAIDHINGGGNKHQKQINGLAMGIWLRKNNYPKGFRILCHNCNMALGIFGYCPHQNSITEL